jgi:Xaa-Pro aminopeptidase
VTPNFVLRGEIETRIANVRRAMNEQGVDVLLAYGNNRLHGSIRYLTDYFPDRTGWVSLSASVTEIMDGAAVMIAQKGPSVLLLDAGLMPNRELCVGRVISGAGFTAKENDGLSLVNLKSVIGDIAAVKTVAIETYDKFPGPLLLGLKEAFPKISFVRSRIVEELRMIKSPFDIEMMRRAALIGDHAHRLLEDTLRSQPGISELAFIRKAESAMREANPIYEDSNPCAPCLICSGYPDQGALLHLPSISKPIDRGDVVHWDLTMRYQGYPIDTSRTRALVRAPASAKRAYDVVKEIHLAVVEAARPGVPAAELVGVGNRVAKKHGEKLWSDFIGHGLGWDIHERPDMGAEQTLLQENMVLAIEPRLSVDGKYLVGIEDMVLIGANGGQLLTHYPADDLEVSTN